MNNFKWNYFERRELLPGSDTEVVACRVNADKSLSYWALDETEGLKLIELRSENDSRHN